MGALTDSSAAARKSKPRLSKRASSSDPFSLPDSELLNAIESLKAELAELKKTGEASAAEITGLKTKLAAAEAKASEAPPTIQRTDEIHTPKSFFGI